MLYPDELQARGFGNDLPERKKMVGVERFELRHPAPKAGALPDCAIPRHAENILCFNDLLNNNKP